MKNRQASVRQTIVLRRLSPARAGFSMVLMLRAVAKPLTSRTQINETRGRTRFFDAPAAEQPFSIAAEQPFLLCR